MIRVGYNILQYNSLLLNTSASPLLKCAPAAGLWNLGRRKMWHYIFTARTMQYREMCLTCAVSSSTEGSVLIRCCCVWFGIVKEWNHPREQPQKANSLQTTRVYCMHHEWLKDSQVWVTICLQGTLLSDLFTLPTSATDSSPPPWASGCICSTKHILSFHIHYYFPRHWGQAFLVHQNRPVCFLTPGRRVIDLSGRSW